jgi:hypothetical protein
LSRFQKVNETGGRLLSIKLIGAALLFSVVTLLAACGNKGKTESASEPRTGVTVTGSNEEQQQAREKPLEGVPNPNLGTFPANSAEQKAPPVPAFFDIAKRQVKDLPALPKASILNLQFGPIAGNETVLIFYSVRGAFEEVTTFYDKAIKEHGWTVQTNTREPDDYTWRLAKGAQDQALLQVKKTEEAEVVQVGINRFRTPSGPAN